MEFSTETLVKYLRDSVLVQDPSTAEDPVWLQMSDSDLAIVLEATTASDIDGVSGAERVCELGKGPVISFMDRSTVYDKELYRLAFETAEQEGIPCQTKTKIAGGNDSGAIHISRGGVRTLAVSVPCRYLHSPSCVIETADFENT